MCASVYVSLVAGPVDGLTFLCLSPFLSLSLNLSICQSVSQSVSQLSVHLCFCLSVCLSVRQCACLFSTLVTHVLGSWNFGSDCPIFSHCSIVALHCRELRWRECTLHIGTIAVSHLLIPCSEASRLASSYLSLAQILSSDPQTRGT